MRDHLVAVAVAAALALAGCGDDDAGALGDEVAACAALDGRPTDDVLEALDAGPCVDADGDLLVALVATQDCDDGTTLAWNDVGWGRTGDTWAAFDDDVASRTPPEAERVACAGG